MSTLGVIRLLATYRTLFPEESETIDAFEALVRAEPRCFVRDCWCGHVTGSAWLINVPGTHVLLTHHRKLDRWLQLGGHCDGDTDVLRVACREAVEESNLAVEPISSALFDIDIHPIPPRNGDPRHLHFDARFLLRVVGSDAFRVSGESLALEWAKIDTIQSFTQEPSMLRMARKWLSRDAKTRSSVTPNASPPLPSDLAPQ
jgi:8-oxo-dGTP pyrophosphatase MutT (NUDIX family)